MSFLLIIAYLLVNFQPHKIIKYQQDEKKIYWHKDVHLNWRDFAGNPDHKSPYSAESTLILSYKMKVKKVAGKTVLDFGVACYFDRSTSWVKPVKKSDQLLAHEKLHFDIAEYYARLLLKEFAENTFNARNYRLKSQEIFIEIYKEYMDQQKHYDALTRNGSNREMQFSWERKMRNLMDKTDQFENKNWQASLIN